MKNIKVKIPEIIFVKLSEMNVLQDQGETPLKELSEKDFVRIKESLIENGFIKPFFVWREPETKKLYYTDGAQRHKVLLEMKNMGFNIPDEFPAMLVTAKDKKEAAKLILLYSSVYGKATNEGLYSFTHTTGIFESFEDWKRFVNLPNINMGTFQKGYVEDIKQEVKPIEDITKELPLINNKDKIKCPKCGHEFER